MLRRYPRHEVRAVIHSFNRRYFHTIHRSYFPDEEYLEAMAFVVIAADIMDYGSPLNVSNLADRVGIARKTLSDKLKRFDAKGFTARDNGGVVINPDLAGSAQAEITLDLICDLIIEAGDALRELRRRGV